MRAKHAQKGGERFTEALLVARAGVAHGLVSFPLSDIHYMEVANRSEWKSRHRLATTMGELSRFHAIAPQGGLQGDPCGVLRPLPLDAPQSWSDQARRTYSLAASTASVRQ